MDIVALSNLLQDCCRDDETEEEKRKVESSTIMTPASFGSIIRNNGVCKENIHSNEIWTHEEGPSLASSCVDHYDDKIEPSYQIYFKQEVGTEDIFLGTDKSPGSFDCSHVVVKVHFPGATLDELNLDVRSHSMLVESSDKKLVLTLPLDVVEEEGNAQWDATKNMLSVTLPVKTQF